MAWCPKCNMEVPDGFMGEHDKQQHPKVADQDGEYLHGAHVVIEAAINELEPGIGHDWATWILDKLAADGWHLFTYDDAEELLHAALMQKVR